jgi:nicotinate-nucleotide pyrophosphorylase (carboxylating)
MTEPRKLILNSGYNDQIKRQLSKLIKVALEEDLDDLGDVTSNAIIQENQCGTAKIISKQEGILAGSFIADMVFQRVNRSIKVIHLANEGDELSNMQIIMKIEGPLKSILIGERTALNFLSRLSGIATLTNRFVKIANFNHVKILDTRKTLPGWRYLDKYAVLVGGGKNHRFGLFDMILIKENHIAAAGSISRAVALCKEYLQSNNLNLMIEIEVKNLEEVIEALEAGVDRIMFDNMTPEKIVEAIKITKGNVETEISGGVNENNLSIYAQAGIDYISIGRLTHSAPAFDFSLLLE